MWQQAGIQKRDLNLEIDALIATTTLAPDLADDLDALRTVGNVAAHPIKSTSTGEVVEFERARLSGSLTFFTSCSTSTSSVLHAAEKRDSLSAKLADAGKPNLNGSSEA